MNENKKKSDSSGDFNDQNNSQDNNKWFSKDDVGEFAKIGKEVLKKTILTGIDVIKDVKDHLPKEATNILNKKKDDIFKNIGKDPSSSLVEFAVEKLFDMSKNYALEVSVRIRKIDEKEKSSKKNKRNNHGD